jgi:predicted nucleic acid-binding protein
MIVIADASPLNYLILIDHVDLLATLFGSILVPQTVFDELSRSGTPAAVRQWMDKPPKWLLVRPASKSADASLNVLDPGERDAIILALELPADLVLMDDAEGRQEAERHHVRVIGTLAVLEQAAKKGLIRFEDSLSRLEQTNFRLSSKLRAAFLDRVAKRKKEKS